MITSVCLCRIRSGNPTRAQGRVQDSLSRPLLWCGGQRTDAVQSNDRRWQIRRVRHHSAQNNLQIIDHFTSPHSFLFALYRCLNLNYPERLPQVSIIIVFHNEAWSALLRTLWSVLNTSPRALLKEIILVDDFSENDVQGQRLQDYIDTMAAPILLFRMPKRSGLIRARLLGASKSTVSVYSAENLPKLFIVASDCIRFHREKCLFSWTRT